MAELIVAFHDFANASKLELKRNGMSSSQGPIGSSETSVNSYEHTLRTNPEEGRPTINLPMNHQFVPAGRKNILAKNPKRN
jgi:hypothetical protein